MSTKNDRAQAPTDLELMLYADGELEGEALAAVEAWLERDRTARRKMLALGITSDIVRSRALGAAEKADGIADLVMGAIAAEAKQEVADPPKKEATVTPLHRKPANDNARSFKVIAALAAAAAAALLLWSRGPAERAGTEPTAALSPHDTAAKVEPRPEGEAVRGVEVSAVDFGGRTGAVFYVPTGSAASDTTAVVWLSDDSSGGNE
jgi:anti-sigma factor RsiW